MAYANGQAMITTSRKFKRSQFFNSINIVWPTNHLRMARLDFWGAVALVCVVGLLVKFAQSLLTN
jgi:hypothetical protein